MCSRIQFLTLDTGEATALWKTFQKMKQNLSKISVFFLSLFNFFVWLFWCAFSRLWLRHLKQQNKRKMKLTQKFGALAKQIFLLLILWRTTKKNPFFNFFFSKKWIHPSERLLFNSQYERTFKIWQSKGN